MADVLVWACIVFAAALILTEVVAGMRKPAPPPKKDDGINTESFPGEAVVKALADKAPRVAGAFAFLVLAGIFAGLLSIDVSAGDGDGSSEPTSTTEPGT